MRKVRITMSELQSKHLAGEIEGVKIEYRGIMFNILRSLHTLHHVSDKTDCAEAGIKIERIEE